MHGQTSSNQIGPVNPTSNFTELFNKGVGIVCEGPAMSADGILFFTDVTDGSVSGKIWKYDTQTNKTNIFRSSSNSATGLIFDREGNLIVAEGENGGRRITKTNLKTGVSNVLTSQFNGKKYNGPNDLCIDNHGRIYFTDSRYLGNESLELPFMGVYRIDVDGQVHLIAANVSRPNGISISPDQKTLYVGSFDYPGKGIYGSLPKEFEGPVSAASGAILAYELFYDGS